MTPADKAKRTVLGIEIPRDELAARLMCVAIGGSPPGATATEALEACDAVMPGFADNFRAQADAAVLYFHERINAARQPS